MENQQTPEELKIELAAMIGAIEHLSIGASAEKVDLYFQMPNDEKPTIIHPDKVKGIYEGVRQEMIHMMGFGRQAVESHYKLPIVQDNLAKCREANAKLVEALRELINSNPLHEGYHEKKLRAIKALQTYETK